MTIMVFFKFYNKDNDGLKSLKKESGDKAKLKERKKVNKKDD